VDHLLGHADALQVLEDVGVDLPLLHRHAGELAGRDLPGVLLLDEDHLVAVGGSRLGILGILGVRVLRVLRLLALLGVGRVALVGVLRQGAVRVRGGLVLLLGHRDLDDLHVVGREALEQVRGLVPLREVLPFEGSREPRGAVKATAAINSPRFRFQPRMFVTYLRQRPGRPSLRWHG
jgi:hypothetical protein